MTWRLSKATTGGPKRVARFICGERPGPGVVCCERL